MTIDLVFNHGIPLHELGRWINASIHFSVGNLSWMYPKPVEIFIKWTIFIGILSLLGCLIFAPMAFLMRGFEILMPKMKIFPQLSIIFGGGFIVFFASYWIIFIFNLITGAVVG